LNIPSIGTDLAVYSITREINSTPTVLRAFYSVIRNAGEISTTGSIYIQWVKLELGSVATPLIPRSTGEELALCQRYYQKSYLQTVFAGAVTSAGSELFHMSGLTSLDYEMTKNVRFPVMKAAPIVTIYDVAGNADKVTMSAGDNIAGTVSNITDSGFFVSGVNGAAALTRILQFHHIRISRV